MRLAEYERLLRRFERREARKDEVLNASDRARARRDRGRVWKVLAHPTGRALIDDLPSPEAMRAAARRHVDVTLGLADMHVRLGPVDLSGVFMPLDSRFRTLAADDMLERKERYWFYVGFKIPAKVGVFCADILVDDHEKRWRCRSSGISRKAIEEALAKPSRRVVVLSVRDQRTADMIVRATRDDVISASVSTEKQWDRLQSEQLVGALHGEARFRRLTKAERRSFNEHMKEMGFGMETPLVEGE